MVDIREQRRDMPDLIFVGTYPARSASFRKISFTPMREGRQLSAATSVFNSLESDALMKTLGIALRCAMGKYETHVRAFFFPLLSSLVIKL